MNPSVFVADRLAVICCCTRREDLIQLKVGNVQQDELEKVKFKLKENRTQSTSGTPINKKKQIELKMKENVLENNLKNSRGTIKKYQHQVVSYKNDEKL